MMRSLLLALAFTLSSAAAVLANDVEAEVNGRVAVGAQPSFILKVHKDLSKANIRVRSSLGTHAQTLGPMDSGGSLEFVLPHKKPGKLDWQGELGVIFADGSSGSMPLRFSTEVKSLMQFEVTSTQADIQHKHEVTIKMDRPCSKVEIEAYGDDGVLLASKGQQVDNEPAGTPITVGWVPGREGPVLRLHVTVYDETGMHRSGEFFPHVVSVPHEEVQFETGKHDVLPDEEQKLVDALEKVQVAVKRYSKAVQVEGKEIRLFVSGHTDTVGNAASNQGLSWRRARAIGEWFKRRGVGVPVYVRGFGESALKVDTPDETDEGRNRRADYDIGVDGPTGSVAGWDRL